MTPVKRTQLAEVCTLLNEEGAHYVLMGGMAMQLWGSSRATRDIALLIEPSHDNAAAVLRAIARVGFGFARDMIPEELLARPITIIGDMPRIDIMLVAWQVQYPEAAAAAVPFELEGVTIPTGSIEHLIRSKRTGRLQDAADVELLEEIRWLRG